MKGERDKQQHPHFPPQTLAKASAFVGYEKFKQIFR